MPARGPRRRGRPHARRALEFNPKNPGALNNLGIARREYQEVPGCYKCAIVLTSEFAHAHSNRGNVLHALRRLHDAEAACRRAIELDPRLVRAWNNLGTTLRDLERPQEASPPAAGRSPKRRTIPPRSTIWRSCSRTRSDSAAP
jgi:tetratricopeptide (TPR) repeat protein